MSWRFFYAHISGQIIGKIPTVSAKMEEKRLEYPMVTFLGNPVSFTGKQLQVGDKALDFPSLQQTFLKNLWLILMARKKS